MHLEAELAQLRDVHPNQITAWKAHLLRGAAGVFGSGSAAKETAGDLKTPHAKTGEQDHRRIKRLVRPGLGFDGLESAERTLAGHEAMAMIRKGQAHGICGRDMQAQVSFGAGLLKVAA